MTPNQKLNAISESGNEAPTGRGANERRQSKLLPANCDQRRQRNQGTDDRPEARDVAFLQSGVDPADDVGRKDQDEAREGEHYAQGELLFAHRLRSVEY